MFPARSWFELVSARFFSMYGRKTMTLVQRKLNKEYGIIRHIEKGMTNKEASELFGVPKNNIST